MTDYQFAFLTSTTHSGLLNAPSLAMRPNSPAVVAGIAWDGATTNTPVYLSLDIDCLDPAYGPGTGTPEPGGLSTAQVMTLLEELHDLPWVGMDLCEVAPAYDHAELTSNAAATLVWTYLCGRIAKIAHRVAEGG
jgi:arginase family enzyme